MTDGYGPCPCPWRHTSCSHLHCTQEGAESLLHGKQLTSSERSDGRGERGEFACSLPTRSDSQKRWDFMSKLNEGKVSYLQAEEVRKEEAAGSRDSSLLHTVRSAPPSQDKGGTVHMSSADCTASLTDQSHGILHGQYPVEKPHLQWQVCSYKIEPCIVRLRLTSQGVSRMTNLAFMKAMWTNYLILLSIHCLVFVTGTVMQLPTDKLIRR